MNQPLVSIQIPTYNQKQYIKEALDSALAQTYESLQVIVADDCSPDYDIFDYLSEYKNNPKVLIHRNEKNLGRVGNYRNTLYNLVKGEWFVNLDGDDQFHNIQFLGEAIEQIISKSEEFNIVSFEFNHGLEYIKKHIKSFQDLNGGNIIVHGLDYLMLQKHYQNFMHANTIFNTAAAKQVDFYNRDILTVDFFSALKIYTEGDLILSSKRIFTWNDHGENASYCSSIEEIENEKLAILDFSKYVEKKLSRKDCAKIVNIFEFFLFKNVFKIYKDKKKSWAFYKYVIFNMKLNKFYIKKLIIECLQ